MMRRFLFFILWFPAFAFSDTYNEVAGSGLFIDSRPQGAKVFIDGVERGTTPFSLESVRPGEYSILITKEGYTERRFRVVVRRSSRIEVSMDMEEAKGQVLVEITRDASAPSSLSMAPLVYADGSRIHEAGFSLPVGWRTITVEAFGWEKESKNIYVAHDSVQKLQFVLKPAVFTLGKTVLRKKRFNPKNAGSLGIAEIGFEVSASGRGTFEIVNEQGRVIYTQSLGPFVSWQQQISWNGRDNNNVLVPDGMYKVRIRAWGTEEDIQDMPVRHSAAQSAELSLQVDSSVEIRPLSLAAASAGLLFASSPEALPAFSYQVEGTMIAGRPPGEEAWKSLPFSLAFRLSFLDKLETTAAFNSAPEFSKTGSSAWGLGASVKWVFIKPRQIKQGFMDGAGAAVEFSYGWAKTGPYTSFGMGTGAGIRFPLLYRRLPGKENSGQENCVNSGKENSGTGKMEDFSLDILFCPFILWAGEKGYPETPVPRLGFGGGPLIKYKNFAGGLSFRWDYAPEFSGDAQNYGPLVSALELKFSPSNMVLSILGGFWYHNKNTGAFFGAGIGIIY